MGRTKGTPRSPTSGRKAGTPNKTTASVKAALEEAFSKLGGVDALVAWGMKEPTEFYKIWAKLLPTEVKANVNGVVTLEQIVAGVTAANEGPMDHG